MIRYTFTSCSLGRVVVATSADGVRAALIGDDDDALAEDIARRFPGALFSDDAGLAAIACDVVRAIDAPDEGVEVPLAPAGTPFQQNVWAALREIPRGETRSYTDIARLIGRDSAVRAVAQACGANPIAILVPCHRVVRGDGGLSGYRWGVERKRMLLQRERT